MRLHRASLIVAAVAATALAACEYSPTSYTPPPPNSVLLKDMQVERLPSPYYHFAYDAAGRLQSASFASGLRTYRVDYAGSRISDMATTFFADNDSLSYAYDEAGRVGFIKYLRAGAIRAVVFFQYDGARLVGVERDVRVAGGYIMDKVSTLRYDNAGNLHQLIQHRPAIDGVQDDATTTDTFEDYDGGINVDGF